MSTKVLMVCLGNICRSPMAEGILRNKVEQSGVEIEVDSCGTAGYHVGESPDSRATQKAKQYNIDISMLRGRQFSAADFDRFDQIYVMDVHNYSNVLAVASGDADSEKVKLILDLIHPGESMSVPDPYYGGDDGFENVYSLLDNACDVIVKNVQ
jgi:protein-tyrosine phosphatase